jgi:hypothetical protein
MTELFPTNTGVRQGCAMAPILFNVFVVALSMIVDRKLVNRGMAIKYRYEGGLFNLNRLKARSTKLRYVTDLQYADDCALVSHSAEELQEILDTYTWAYAALGLKLNETKTKILSTPPGSSLYAARKDDEIKNRLSAASRAFWKLRGRVFNNHDLTINTKVAVYRAVIIPTLTYGCETWVNYRRHTKSLEKLQQRHLRQLLQR